MPKIDEYLRITAAAQHLGVCINTLRNWEAAGKLRVYRNPLNGYRLYKIGDLDDLLQQIEQSSAQHPRKPK